MATLPAKTQLKDATRFARSSLDGNSQFILNHVIGFYFIELGPIVGVIHRKSWNEWTLVAKKFQDSRQVDGIFWREKAAEV